MDLYEFVLIFSPLIFIVALISYKIIYKIIQNQKKEEDKARIAMLKKRLHETANFTISNMLIGSNNVNLAYDETRNKICLVKKTYDFRIYDFRDILSAEIIENGETVTKTETKSKSRLGRAVVGGVLFGGAGAIVGGLTGKSESASTSTDYVTQIDLKVIVKDTQNPVHIISFLSGTTVKQSGLYKSTIEKAMKWQAIMNVLISQADEKDNAGVEIEQFANEPPQKNNMVSAEIYKLLELKNHGVITEQEFEAQKKKLLA